MLGLRRIDKADLRRIAKSTGATVVTTLAQPDGTEKFEKTNLGVAECVYEENLGDVDYVFIKNTKTSPFPVCTAILRGANNHMLDEIDRSLHDSICVLKRTLESGKIVAGGGAVEVALSVYLDKLSKKYSSRD